MESLSDKLKKLGVQVGAEDLPHPQPKASPSTLEDVLPGRWISTRHGETFLVKKEYPQNHRQGQYTLRPASSLNPVARWLDAPDLVHIPLEDFVFIDTETTSLSGGAGTYTFLVGAGRFENESFCVYQYFMRDPSEEPAQLAALESFLTTSRVVVSYNGKAFDLPRLGSRYRTHGWPVPLQDIIHIDLLHLSRRLYADLLTDCTLGNVEYSLLDFERDEEDVPGWQVAELFFRYLETKDPAPLRSIFYHNEMDVISLPALLNLLSSRLASPLPGSKGQLDDLIPLGKFFADLEDYDLAVKLLENALENYQLPPDLQLEGIKNLSFLYKKRQDFQRALPLWEEAAAQDQFYAYIELAKVYEHQQQSYPEAIHWTLSALELCHNRSGSRTPEEDRIAQLKHRLQRLKRKLAREE